MKAIKRFNNNVVLCLDNEGNEVVAFGRGIGFGKMPKELALRDIEKTFYNVNENVYSILSSLPPEIIEIASNIIEYAGTVLDYPVSSNTVLTLADHIQFAVQRYQKGISIKLPISADIRYLYEKETAVGEYGRALIQKKLKFRLPPEEACYIALHLISNEKSCIAVQNEKSDDELIEVILQIVENCFQIKIDRTGFNYSRFVSHMHYLFERQNHGMTLRSENQELFESVSKTYPKTYQCVLEITRFLLKNRNLSLNEEEQLYLMIHINRLCSRN